MASFGFSPSDILNLITLIKKTHSRWRDACGEYAEVTGTLTSFESVSRRLYSLTERNDVLRSDEASDLVEILDEGYTSVKSLYKIIRKYPSLGSRKSKNWERIRFGSKGEDIARLRNQLTTHVAFINAFLTTESFASIRELKNRSGANEQDVQEILVWVRKIYAEEIRRSSDSASTATGWTEYVGDNKAYWRQFRSQLVTCGVNSRTLKDHEHRIKRYLLGLVEGQKYHVEMSGEESEPNVLNEDAAQSFNAENPHRTSLIPQSQSAAGHLTTSIVAQTKPSMTQKPLETSALHEIDAGSYMSPLHAASKAPNHRATHNIEAEGDFHDQNRNSSEHPRDRLVSRLDTFIEEDPQFDKAQSKSAAFEEVLNALLKYERVEGRDPDTTQINQLQRAFEDARNAKANMPKRSSQGETQQRSTSQLSHLEESSQHSAQVKSKTREEQDATNNPGDEQDDDDYSFTKNLNAQHIEDARKSRMGCQRDPKEAPQRRDKRLNTALTRSRSMSDLSESSDDIRSLSGSDYSSDDYSPRRKKSRMPAAMGALFALGALKSMYDSRKRAERSLR